MMSGLVQAATSGLRASLMRTTRWAGGIAAVGGFVADVLQPIAPFAAWLAVIAAVALVGVGGAILLKMLSRDRGLPALVFAGAAFAITGGLWATQQATAAENGVLADLVPAIARIQESLGLIEKKIERIEAKVDDIADSVAAIADAFANLGKQGGLIAEPQRPEEFYHNARIHELSGDMVNARADYLAFARFGVDAIDPYLRLATLLRVQDGRAGAREVIGELLRQKPSTALELIHLLQFDDAARKERLDAFLAAHPDHGPAWRFLADEFSEDRLGTRALADKRAEGDALDRFLSFEADGRLLPYFVDHQLLAEWLDDARRRKAALGDLSGGSFRPTLLVMPAGDGFMVTISIPEPATAIFWRLGAGGAFTDTGQAGAVDQTTGKPIPNMAFPLPLDTPPGTIEIRYTDLSGRDVGPFAFPFDPVAAIADSHKKALELTWTSWIAFDASGFRGNVYFTQIVTMRCAVKDAVYGFNGGPLERRLELPPCDLKNPWAMPDGFLPYLKVGEDVTSMSVKLTYADGTDSPVREFRRP